MNTTILKELAKGERDEDFDKKTWLEFKTLAMSKNKRQRELENHSQINHYSGRLPFNIFKRNCEESIRFHIS